MVVNLLCSPVYHLPVPRFGRSVSVESPSGQKLVKNQNRVSSRTRTPSSSDRVRPFPTPITLTA